MRWRSTVLCAVVATVATGCTSQVMVASDAAEPDAVMGIQKVFPDGQRIDADVMAHAIATLVSQGDKGLVPAFLDEVEKETSCKAKAFTASAPAGDDNRDHLLRVGNRTMADLRRDPSVSYLGDALLPVDVPFKVKDTRTNTFVDAGWVEVIAFLACGPPRGR